MTGKLQLLQTKSDLGQWISWIMMDGCTQSGVMVIIRKRKKKLQQPTWNIHLSTFNEHLGSGETLASTFYWEWIEIIKNWSHTQRPQFIISVLNPYTLTFVACSFHLSTHLPVWPLSKNKRQWYHKRKNLRQWNLGPAHLNILG